MDPFSSEGGEQISTRYLMFLPSGDLMCVLQNSSLSTTPSTKANTPKLLTSTPPPSPKPTSYPLESSNSAPKLPTATPKAPSPVSKKNQDPTSLPSRYSHSTPSGTHPAPPDKSKNS
ncbi:MAG: hypothetical protein Q9190_005153 [Brigantiaea leucoxantha]